MTDIVKRLRSPVDERDYFLSQWPGEEHHTLDAVRFDAARVIERLWDALWELSSSQDPDTRGIATAALRDTE